MPNILVTQTAVEQSIAQHSTDPFILLLTIEHEVLSTPLRICRNFEAVVSRGNTYTAFPFMASLPTDSDEAPEARVTISNVDRRIGRALQSITTPAECTLELVLASDLDVVERAWGGLSFTRATWDANQVQIGLSHLAYWDEPWPRKRITPRTFPGLFP